MSDESKVTLEDLGQRLERLERFVTNTIYGNQQLIKNMIEQVEYGLKEIEQVNSRKNKGWKRWFC